MAKDEGLSLLQFCDGRFTAIETSMLNMENSMRNIEGELRSELYDAKDENSRLVAENKSFAQFRSGYMNVRERNFLKFLQDCCVGEDDIHGEKLEILNRTIEHGGDVVSDARMFRERRPDREKFHFRSLYGMDPEEVEELGMVHLLTGTGKHTMINSLQQSGTGSRQCSESWTMLALPSSKACL